MILAETRCNGPGPFYSDMLTHLLWWCRSAAFRNQDAVFDEQFSRLPNPPVFKREESNRNLIVPDDPELAATILRLVLPEKRHKWFRSMKRSQALVLSVFGNLKMLNRTSCLSEVTADDSVVPAFGRRPMEPSDLELEHDVSSLNKVRAISVDVLVSRSTVTSVDCKLSEQEVGCCSRPRLKKSDPEYCDGSFLRQGARSHRCAALAERGVSSWEHIPSVLNWQADRDPSRCRLAEPYQLVRNVLAASVEGGRSGRAAGTRCLCTTSEIQLPAL